MYTVIGLKETAEILSRLKFEEDSIIELDIDEFVNGKFTKKHPERLFAYNDGVRDTLVHTWNQQKWEEWLNYAVDCIRKQPRGRGKEPNTVYFVRNPAIWVGRVRGTYKIVFTDNGEGYCDIIIYYDDDDDEDYTVERIWLTRELINQITSPADVLEFL